MHPSPARSHSPSIRADLLRFSPAADSNEQTVMRAFREKIHKHKKIDDADDMLDGMLGHPKKSSTSFSDVELKYKAR